MAANVSLLSDMSDKLADYCRTFFKLDDRQLSSEEMGEFYYAFNKANAFSSATPRALVPATAGAMICSRTARDAQTGQAIRPRAP